MALGAGAQPHWAKGAFPPHPNAGIPSAALQVEMGDVQLLLEYL